jgi:hypothetical protein
VIEAVVFVTLGALVGHAVTVVALLHAGVRLAPVAVHGASAIAWHALQIAALLLAGMVAFYWHAAAFFGMGVMLFVFGFSAVYKSISLRFLVMLARAPGYTLTLADAQERLVVKSFRERVEMLTATGLALSTSEGYRLSEAGLRTAGRIAAVRRLFGARASGLYFTKT